MFRFPTFLGDVTEWIRQTIEVHDKNLEDWKLLPESYIQGRKVRRVPSASNNVVAGDAEGDFNYDASYLYLLINNAGTLAWRRVAISSW